MKKLYIEYLAATLIVFSTMNCSGQDSNKFIIHTKNCNYLFAGIHNSIFIITSQDTVSTEQISAYLSTPSGYINETKPIKLGLEKRFGEFSIRPDSVGVVKFYNNDTEIGTIRVKPIEAVCRFAGYKANSGAKISKATFRAQNGIVAYVECCGFDARCNMVDFEVLRVPPNKVSSKTINRGGRFEQETLSLINQAESGDLYIFRNIYYQCPSSDKQRSEDMIVEIE